MTRVSAPGGLVYSGRRKWLHMECFRIISSDPIFVSSLDFNFVQFFFFFSVPVYTNLQLCMHTAI